MDIPVEFDFKGKHFSGTLTAVAGAGSRRYHLMIDNYYRGQLMLVEDNENPALPRDPAHIKYKWRFTSQAGEVPELSALFSKLVPMP